jgi:hypothetical protein
LSCGLTSALTAPLALKSLCMRSGNSPYINLSGMQGWHLRGVWHPLLPGLHWQGWQAWETWR